VKYKGIIFDLDGVICFTDEYHYLAWKKLADSIGADFDRTKNDRLRGVSRMESLEIVLEGYNGAPFSEEEKQALAKSKNDNYRMSLQEMTTKDLSDEVKATLNGLRSLGIKLAIGSSSKNTELILERIGLSGFFDAVADGNDISKSKPDPEVFIKAAQKLCLDPKDCLVVEDAKAGVEAANAGGFQSAGLGPAAAEELATYSIGSFCELLRLA